MKRPMISAFAVVTLVLLAVGTTVLWSHTPSTELSAGTAAMPSLLELHAAADANKVPHQEMEDQSLIFPSVAKR